MRDRLLEALERTRPFRQFKDALLSFPAVRDAWHAYEETQLQEEARAWPRHHDIDAELVERAPPPAG